MKQLLMMTVIGCLAFASLSCGDSGISYPTGDGGWQVAISLGVIPPRIDDVPVLISVRVDVINLTDGSRSPDGSTIVVTTTGGCFPNGESEIELPTTAGSVETELEIKLPGTYQVEAEYPEESCATTVEFSVGLE
jgi:hypothetical protein